MKDFINKMIAIEKRTAKERGAYNLFGLFKREGSSRWWDIIVAADWISDRQEAVGYLIDEMKKDFVTDDYLMISHVEVVTKIDPDLAYVTRLQSMYGVPQLLQCTVFNKDIKEAFLIAFKSPQAA